MTKRWVAHAAAEVITPSGKILKPLHALDYEHEAKMQFNHLGTPHGVIQGGGSELYRQVLEAGTKMKALGNWPPEVVRDAALFATFWNASLNNHANTFVQRFINMCMQHKLGLIMEECDE